MGHKAGKWMMAVAAAVLLLSGCKREPTAVEIMKEAVENTNKAGSFAGKIVMDAGIGMQESGMSLGLDMNMDLDIEAVKETGACHLKGSVNAGLADMLVNMEVYNVPEDDGNGFVTYLNVADTWMKTRSDTMDEKQNIASLMNLESYIKNGSKLELEKDTRKEEGRDVYVITTSAGSSGFSGAGAILGSMFGGAGEAQEGLDFDDIKDIQLDVTFKIYKDSMLPASVSMVLSGNDGDGFVIPDNMGREISLKDINFILSFKEFDTVENIEVPSEAADAQSDPMDIMGDLEKDDAQVETENTSEPELQKDDDGNYILTDWEKKRKIAIPLPEGMETDQYSMDTSITLYKDYMWRCKASHRLYIR